MSIDDIVRSIVENPASHKRPDGYWKDFDNCKKELDIVIEKIGHFPQTKDIQQECSSLAGALVKYHGGLDKIKREHYSLKTPTPKGIWQDSAYMREQLDIIVKEKGYFPTQAELKAINGKLCAAVSRYHGGMTVVRKKYGYDLLERPKKYWKDYGNIRKELDEMIADIGHFPSAPELRVANLGLALGIKRYHGGMRKIRKLYGVDELKHPDGYWSDMDNVRARLDPIVKELGRFPSREELRETDKPLASAVGRMGVNKVRAMYGFEPLIRPCGFYEDIENVRKEILYWIDAVGHFPKQDEIGDPGLLGGIQVYYGGLRKLRRTLGL